MRGALAQTKTSKKIGPGEAPSWTVPSELPEGTYQVITKDGNKVATRLSTGTEKRAAENDNEDDSEFKTDLALWLSIIALILASIVFGSWVRDAIRKQVPGPPG
jgi:hypothetical protein